MSMFSPAMCESEFLFEFLFVRNVVLIAFTDEAIIVSFMLPVIQREYSVLLGKVLGNFT